MREISTTKRKFGYQPALPALCPRVGKVDDEYELDEDKGEAPEEPEVHPVPEVHQSMIKLGSVVNVFGKFFDTFLERSEMYLSDELDDFFE